MQCDIAKRSTRSNNLHNAVVPYIWFHYTVSEIILHNIIEVQYYGMHCHPQRNVRHWLVLRNVFKL